MKFFWFGKKAAGLHYLQKLFELLEPEFVRRLGNYSSFWSQNLFVGWGDFNDLSD